MTIEFVAFKEEVFISLVIGLIFLVRERKPLPFLLLLVGVLLVGSWIPAMLAALLYLYRVNQGAARWMQVKDLIGLFLLLCGTACSEDQQAMFSLVGAVLIGFSYGKGLFGPLVAMIYVRQFNSSSELMKMTWISAGVFVVIQEILHWTKSSRKAEILIWSDVVLSLAAFGGMSEVAQRANESTLQIVSAGIALAIFVGISIWSWVRPEKFYEIYHLSRRAGSRLIEWGESRLSKGVSWFPERKNTDEVTLSGSFNGFFVLVLFSLILVLFSLLMGSGSIL